jgi:hypothetical protein
MGVNAEASAKFVRELSDLCERIASKGFEIHTLEIYRALFGSWCLIILKGHEATRFYWDGKEGFLSVEKSLKINLSSPNEWRDEKNVAPENPIAFVFDYVSQER